MRPRVSLLLLFLFSLSLAGAVQNYSSSHASEDQYARMSVDGAKIFQDHCAACHGTDGKGHGPTATALKDPVPDLTLISRKNHGKFPHDGVRNAIEGLLPLTRAHGTREMPIWGPVFHQVEADQDWGEVRLEAVTKHIESIQQK
jgi:mono/diheme cytochrome c family protein